MKHAGLFLAVLMAILATAVMAPTVQAAPTANMEFVTPSSGNEVQVLVHINTPDVKIRSLVMELGFNPSGYTFIKAAPADPNFFGALIEPTFNRTKLGFYGNGAFGENVLLCENPANTPDIVTVACAILTTDKTKGFSGTTAIVLTFRRTSSVAATDKSGVFSIRNLSLTDLAGASLTPVLERPADYKGIEVTNTPNPFNPATQIQFGLPVDENVTIDVYNVLGQRVWTLATSYKLAGDYSILWDGKDDAGRQLASGIYVCRVTAGKLAAMHKMLLLK